MRSSVAAFVLLIWLVAPVTAQAWRPPVPGDVARPFAYARGAPFAAGAHRGVDLRAQVDERVVAACTGEVVTAGPHVVTLRCGPWRVTALPLSSVSVRVGARVRSGAAVGRVGTMAGHTGLHLGVRRSDDRFAYVDPAPLLGTPSSPPPPVTAVPREGPRGPLTGHTGRAHPHAVPADVAPARAAPADAAPANAAPANPAPANPAPANPAPSRGAAQTEVLGSPGPDGVRVSAPGGAGGLAPWPAWVGLVLLVLGVVGGGVKIGLRGRTSPLAEPAPEQVPSAP